MSIKVKTLVFEDSNGVLWGVRLNSDGSASAGHFRYDYTPGSTHGRRTFTLTAALAAQLSERDDSYYMHMPLTDGAQTLNQVLTAA